MNSSCRSLVLCLLLAGALPPVVQAAEDVAWNKLSSTHFIVLYSGGESELYRTVAERAEACYQTIAADLGYTRYQKFWLWDNRVKILIYPTAAAFTAACQAPAWAIGRASVERHEIAGFRQGRDAFLDSLLPHELSHLILGDFIGREHIPLWLNEGFAQWEQSRGRPAKESLPPLTFRLKDLMTLDIRQEADRARVSLFYAQSASLVGFLIRTRGGEAFGAFCRGLRDGKPCEAALTAAYPGDITSLENLEEKWLKSHDVTK